MVPRQPRNLRLDRFSLKADSPDTPQTESSKPVSASLLLGLGSQHIKSVTNWPPLKNTMLDLPERARYIRQLILMGSEGDVEN